MVCVWNDHYHYFKRRHFTLIHRLCRAMFVPYIERPLVSKIFHCIAISFPFVALTRYDGIVHKSENVSVSSDFLHGLFCY